MAPGGWITIHTTTSTAATAWGPYVFFGGAYAHEVFFGGAYAHEGSWPGSYTRALYQPTEPEIKDRPGFRQQRGARPAHKSVSERICSKPRVLD